MPADGGPNLPLQRAAKAEISRHGGAQERQAGSLCEHVKESRMCLASVLYVHLESLGSHGGMQSSKIQGEYAETRFCVSQIIQESVSELEGEELKLIGAVEAEGEQERRKAAAQIRRAAGRARRAAARLDQERRVNAR